MTSAALGAARQRVAAPVAACVQQRRWASTEPAKTDEPVALSREQRMERDFDVPEPITSLPVWVGETSPEIEPKGAQKDMGKYFSPFPEDVLKDLTVRIHKPTHNVMTSMREDTEGWAMEAETNKPRWTNMLMAYTSSADPLGQTGMRKLRFSTAEAAARFAERNGWKFYVDEPPLVLSVYGKQEYAANFLNPHVRRRREAWSEKDLCQVEFGHEERGKPTWPNLKHTKYGEKESKVVSKTHWSDPHPNNHSAKTWYRAGLKAKQDLARKIGK